MNRYSRYWLCVIGLLFAVGCSKSTNPQSETKPQIATEPLSAAEKKAANFLKLFWLGYCNHSDNNQRPPGKLEDLKTVISSDEPIDFDHYHIIWGVDLKPIVKSRTILAYEVDVPEKGGMVLFPDGNVERVSAAEFATLPKAIAAKPIAERRADVTFTAAEYLAEYANSRLSMAQNYQGQVIELKGVVKGLGLGSRAELLVISTGKEQEAVRCFFPDDEEFFAKTSKGQEVTIKGFVRDPQGSPMLTNCGIARLGPSTGIAITAEELAKEFAADNAKASEKYKGKSLVISGEVLSASTSASFYSVKLKGVADQPVKCTFWSRADLDKKLVPGAKIKLYAEYDGGDIWMTNCQLISK
jgi:uncharacterized protein (DUF1330 family)